MSTNKDYYLILSNRDRNDVVKLISIYHCPDCYYIFDTKKQYMQHIEYCCIGRTSDIASIKNLYNPSIHAVPKHRCDVILTSGVRAGEPCLNRMSSCCYIHQSYNKQKQNERQDKKQNEIINGLCKSLDKYL